jgi:hypothetical protein
MERGRKNPENMDIMRRALDQPMTKDIIAGSAPEQPATMNKIESALEQPTILDMTGSTL